MTKLKTFNQFVNESIDHRVDRALDTLHKINGPLRELLEAFEKKLEHMKERGSFWYNRESRNISKEHYAIDVKTYEWPDVDDWREAIGDPEASEEQMMDHWWRWIEMEIEDFEENIFLPEFGEYFDEIRMGGQSGGWMCLIPSNGPSTLAHDVDVMVDPYIDFLTNLEPDEISQLEQALEMSEEERARMTELGILEIGDTLDNLMREYNDAKQEIEKSIATLNKHEEACLFTIQKHKEFKAEAKQNFLETEKENYY